MTREEKQKVNKERLNRAAQKVRDGLNKSLRNLRTLHTTAEALFNAGEFHGGKMRNLDDAECWLADTRTALTEFLKD